MELANFTVQELPDVLAAKYKYRPLPKYIREDVLSIFAANLNGFENPDRECVINATIVARKFDRVVVGHYGAYVEIDKEDFVGKYLPAPGQEWRLNKTYVQEHRPNLKYEWYEVEGKKLYWQLGTVKYADYKAGKFYISVFDFD